MEIRESSDISLEPELNPLHNPILAENLDLWARVYASVPLEERSQALRQLLADLRAGKPATAMESDLAAPGHMHDFACRRCGKLNEGGQKFCGFCGAETLSATNRDAKISGPAYKSPDANSVSRSFPDLRSTELEPRNDLKPNDVKPNNDSPFPSLQPASAVGSRQLDSLREISFSTIYDAEESPRNGFRYTIVALVVILCLGAISYVQWRPQMRAAWMRIMVMAGAAPANPISSSSPTNTPAANANPSTTPDANSNASTPSTPAASTLAASNANPPTDLASTSTPSTAANTPASQPATPSVTTQPDDANNQNLPASPANAPAASAERTADTETPANAPTKPQTAKAEAPHQPLTQAARVDRVSSSLVDNGSAELATAQGYLNGTTGARNPAQAATWLWKAVSKQNPTALVLLSDLYARGDGVDKNCDQARMLLVAAAKKNAPDAGAKLRFLESNGCR